MHLLTYISDYTGTAETVAKDLEDIQRVAKRENVKHSITGVLFYLDGQFLQIVEGEDSQLKQLLRNVEVDYRNRNVEVLINTPIEKRGFYDWNMDTFNLSTGHQFNRDNMRSLSKSFSKNLLPRSDMLVVFYKKLLEKAEA